MAGAIRHYLREYLIGDKVSLSSGMRQQQGSGISDVSWSKSNVPDLFYRFRNTWTSHEYRVEDILLASIKAELTLLIGGTEQCQEVESTEVCPIIEDKTYTLQLEWEVQSTKAIVTCLSSMRAPHSCQLQVERDASSDVPQGESITDKRSSVTAQIGQAWKAGTPF